MFRRQFEKTLNRKSPSKFDSIKDRIPNSNVRSVTSKKPWIIGLSAIGSVAVAGIVVAVTLTSVSSKNPLLPEPPVAKQLNAPSKPLNSPKQKPNAQYLQGLKDFAVNFATYTDKEEENNVFSPLSIATAFSMAYEGARAETKEELGKMLGYDGSFDVKTCVAEMLKATHFTAEDKEGKKAYCDVADAIFIDREFSPFLSENYLKTLTDYYYAEAFSGVLKSDEMHEMLASWINSKTNELFHLNADSFKEFAGILWLCNTVYLKANWACGIFEETRSFYPRQGAAKETTFLHGYVQTNGYASDSIYVCDIPLYGGLSFRVAVEKPSCEPLFLPPTTYAEQEQYWFRNILNPEQLSEVKAIDLEFIMPTFKSHQKYDLKEVLQDAGVVRNAFTPKVADFHDMVNSVEHDPFISKAIHEALVDVNKDGIEAAAYTVIEMTDESVSVGPALEKWVIKLDRPFHYGIVDSLGYPLFLGTVNTAE